MLPLSDDNKSDFMEEFYSTVRYLAGILNFDNNILMVYIVDVMLSIVSIRQIGIQIRVKISSQGGSSDLVLLMVLDVMYDYFYVILVRYKK